MASAVTEQPRPQAAKPASDPFADPIAFLRANGYRPLGNPEWPDCLWIDENKPLYPREETVDVLAPFMRKATAKEKEKGMPVGFDMKPVKQRSADAHGNVTEIEVKQIRHIPAQVPVTRQQALWIILEKMQKKQVDEARAAAEAAKRKREEAI